ncbi:MAG: HlyD family type I secretion periplasmic adaptor subunit [Gammaproteobacteria bacterium]
MSHHLKVLRHAWSHRKEMDRQRRSAKEAEFLPAALEVEATPPAPLGRAIMWFIMAFFVIAVIWSCIGEMDIVAVAQGKIIPSGHTKTIQPLESGVVRVIHVRNGDRVNEGDLLIELDTTSTQADHDRLEKERQGLVLDQARLTALIQATKRNQEKPTFTLPLALDPVTEALQKSMMESAWRQHRARVAVLDNTIVKTKAERSVTQALIKRLTETVPLITKRADSLKELVKKGLASEHAWLELEQERIEQVRDLEVNRERLQETEAAIREAEQQKLAVQAEFEQALYSELDKVHRQINSIEKELVKTAQRNTLQRLKAPVDGVVQQLAVHTVGGVVTPAQPLLVIVPVKKNLEVEAWVENKDIGFVREGQSAAIKIDTFPFTKYGTIDGNVAKVSEDAVTDEEKGLVFSARVLMERSSLWVENKLVNLSPGMSVTVEVKTGKRRLIEFVMAPLIKGITETGRER